MAPRNANALVVLMIAFFVLAGTPATRALECGTVVINIAPCMSYARGIGSLTAACCNGVRSLNAAASTTADRQTACNCLKMAVSRIPGINADLVAGIPPSAMSLSPTPSEPPPNAQRYYKIIEEGV